MSGASPGSELCASSGRTYTLLGRRVQQRKIPLADLRPALADIVEVIVRPVQYVLDDAACRAVHHVDSPVRVVPARALVPDSARVPHWAHDPVLAEELELVGLILGSLVI